MLISNFKELENTYEQLKINNASPVILQAVNKSLEESKKLFTDYLLSLFKMLQENFAKDRAHKTIYYFFDERNNHIEMLSICNQLKTLANTPDSTLQNMQMTLENQKTQLATMKKDYSKKMLWTYNSHILHFKRSSSTKNLMEMQENYQDMYTIYETLFDASQHLVLTISSSVLNSMLDDLEIFNQAIASLEKKLHPSPLQEMEVMRKVFNA